ncbi:lipopolysaccharide biosynthesis protein [Pseudidiomarina andamanensis]|uniref:Lipopolysaccharide biosynthesis protein n=1 Tax=Pseudidiomarina andamanensis TaxID=1940690 RepID=A0AA92IMK6_9GAMM|nr:lipopolysaccharide biosynthesis protein [Pseudidiomarina andamanensis]MDS0217748.1 lipopolysaccharide biosynthesis protein [Pseudidiomarina andamanensis]QGT96736.1 lipopolysaccharide biosynthesis protein [Pseudidiomarina andamanensis]
MNLSQKTTSGIIWNFFEQFARRGFGVLVTLVLAYFLTPEDYGLVAMMAVFLALGSSLMQSGFSQALIRMPDVTQTDYNTAFFANIVLGIVAYALLFLIAPLISVFYEEPQLTLLIRVASLSIVISSFQVVQQASLSRELNFKAQVKAVLPASIISGVIAVWFAYLDFGVWALVGQMILASLLQTLFLWLVQGWRPTKDFSLPALKDMYSFGYKLFLSGVLDTIFQNLYVVVIAKIFSAPIAGLYFFANQIKQIVIAQLVSSVQAVTYPALSKLNTDDEILRRGYSRVIRAITFIVFPALAFLAVLAEPIFSIFLPDKWFAAASYLQLMCLASFLIPVHSVNLNILKVKGRSDLFLLLEVLKKTVAIVIMAISLQGGIYGLLVGQIITSVIVFIPNSYFSKKLIGYGVYSQLGDFGFYGFSAAAVSVSTLLLSNYYNVGDFTLILIGLPTMIVLYFGACFLFKKSDLTMMAQLLKPSKRN